MARAPFDPLAIKNIKAAMRTHSAADGYRLTAEEIAALAIECGLTEQQVRKWAENERYRHPTESSMTAFLNDDGEKV
jgi:hypothetical protein